MIHARAVTISFSLFEITLEGLIVLGRSSKTSGEVFDQLRLLCCSMTVGGGGVANDVGSSNIIQYFDGSEYICLYTQIQLYLNGAKHPYFISNVLHKIPALSYPYTAPPKVTRSTRWLP